MTDTEILEAMRQMLEPINLKLTNLDNRLSNMDNRISNLDNRITNLEYEMRKGFREYKILPHGVKDIQKDSSLPTYASMLHAVQL